MRIAGVLQRRGQVDRFVGYSGAADRSVTGGEKRELGVIGTHLGEVGHGQGLVVQHQTTARRIVQILSAVAAEVDPGVPLKRGLDSVVSCARAVEHDPPVGGKQLLEARATELRWGQVS